MTDDLTPDFNRLPLEPHHPRLVGVTGYATSGKDEVAKILGNLYGYERHGFADKLKEFVAAFDPWVKVDSNGYLTRASELVATLGDVEAKTHPEYRRILQQVGTKARDILDPDLWINALGSTVLSCQDQDIPVVVPDVRFANEVSLIQDLGGVVFRVTRPGVEAQSDHPSEISLDGYDFPVINNDGSLLDLQGEVMIALGDLG